MAVVQPTYLQFPPSDSPDVVGYAMYLSESPAPVDYDSEKFDLGNPPIVDGMVKVDLAQVPGMITKDGVYNLGVTAVDDAGNESSMSIINDVPLDFQAPNPPGPVEIVSS